MLAEALGMMRRVMPVILRIGQLNQQGALAVGTAEGVIGGALWPATQNTPHAAF